MRCAKSSLHFIQQNKKSVAGKPEVAGYEFQSNGIIKMLSELQDKFQAEKVDLEKAEFNKKASFEVTASGLQNEVEAEKKDLDKKLVFKQKKLGAKAKVEDQPSTTMDTKKSDEEYLEDISTTCDQKATDFKARLKLSGEELEVVKKTIDVMSSCEVMGNEEKHLWKSFIQIKSKSATSLANFRLNQKRIDAKERITFFLQREAERIQSSALAKMALVLSTQADDDSTMKMMKNTLTKLLEDLQQKAGADQTKKDACDKKLAVNKQTRAEKTASTEELQADLDMLQAEVAKFEKEIAELTEQVADLDSTVKNATAIRKEEKAKNAETISDAQAAQAAVTQATSVLKEFYEKAGQATALVQKQKSGQPAIFDSPCKGMGGEMAVWSACSRSLPRTLRSGKQMTTDMKHKKESATDSKARISEKGSDFDMEEQALNASLAEYDALKEECLNTGLDYEEEKKRREETIESLQKALTMLNNLGTGVTAER